MGLGTGPESDNVKRLQGVETFFFDLDGCIWFGDELAPNAPELVQSLRHAGRRVAFVSNITGATAAHVAAKLTRLGIPATEADTMTPFSILTQHPYLQNDPAVFLIGNDAMRNACHDVGVRLTEVPASADVVVVSRDPELTYADLAAACLALQGGAPMLALNLDSRVPVGNGVYLPGNGAIVAALTTATGATVEAIGKPSAYFFDRALERFGAERSTTAMVGDNLDSDIAGGVTAGLLTVQVGDSDFSLAATPPVPHLKVRDLHDLQNMLDLVLAISG